MNKTSADTPLVIEASICPYRPAEPVWDVHAMIREANACLAAGAAIVHHHHDMRLDEQASIEEMLVMGRAVKAQFPDAILYPDFLKAATVEGKVAHIAPLAQAQVLGMVPVDPGRANSGQLDDHGVPYGNNVVQYSFDDANATLKLAKQLQVPLAVGIYEAYNLRWALAQEAAGRMPPGTMVKLYFGGRYSLIHIGRRALNFGLPLTRESIDAYLKMMEGSRLPWCVGLMGDALMDSTVVRYILERGGHLRVGIEDAASCSPATNHEMVEAAVALAQEVGRPVVQGSAAWQALGRPEQARVAA
jgi:uncharacterized protein (DUF849 family)